MITDDGWLDYAIRMPGPSWHTNTGVNPISGIFMHSAEGYASTLLDPNSQWGYKGNHSWHLTNLFDGRVIQHYPFFARCWHATAANQSYIGVENEGDAPRDPTLNDAQIANAKRFIKEISEWKGWMPSRPVSLTDVTHTLWEHNEVVRLGGSGSECPSGRIPWEKILGDAMQDLADKERMIALIVATLKRPDYILALAPDDVVTGEHVIEVQSGISTDEPIRIRIR